MYKSFKEMPIWQEAMSVAEVVFRLTEEFPKREDYCLTSQMRRSALSVASNIAEAFGRKHTHDKMNFYYYARGSVTETQSHLEYARRVGYLDLETAGEIDGRLSRLYNDLNKVIVSLRTN